jgi:anti-sigma factor RsiW
MADSIQNQLGAYLDGELDERAQAAVRAHLETCPACQNELEELRRISHLLRAAPLPEMLPAREFKAQLMLQLPRRTEAPRSQPKNGLLPWMAPALVLAGWIFFQLALNFSGLVSLANQFGILGGTAMPAGGPPQTTWFAAFGALLGGLLGQPGQSILQAFNAFDLFRLDLAEFLFWQVGIAVVYWGVLFVVWQTQRKPRQSSPAAG